MKLINGIFEFIDDVKEALIEPTHFITVHSKKLLSKYKTIIETPFKESKQDSNTKHKTNSSKPQNSYGQSYDEEYDFETPSYRDIRPDYDEDGREIDYDSDEEVWY